MPRILLVEDNEDMAAGIRHNLELEGYEVSVVHDGAAAVRSVRDAAPDLMVLDVMLPEMDGFQVLKLVREEGASFPILLLTARGEEADKVRAFRLDADQYVTKPFGLLELLERVRALLRRRTPRSPTGSGDDSTRSCIRFGDVEVDTAARKVKKAGDEVGLTPRAYDLLLALVRNEGRVLSRQDLLREVWGHIGSVLTRTVDSHVSELRQKLEDDAAEPRHIHTVWKIGYRFESGD